MTTDEDREFARKLARRIYQNHLAHNPAGCDANHIAINLSYEESLYRGLLAECAFSHEFGNKVSEAISHYGDGGRDFKLHLMTDKDGSLFIPIDVKTKSVQRSWHGLRQSGTHLRVPVSRVLPYTIYVFGIYFEQTDDAEVLRWDWGLSLIKRNERSVFPNGNGEEAYIKPFESLRELDELKSRIVMP